MITSDTFYAKNPIRAKEIKNTRNSKVVSLQKIVITQNLYLLEHPKAKVETAVKKIQAKSEALKIANWIETVTNERTIEININEESLSQESLLDGCYVLKTDLTKKAITAKQAHERYKELIKVECAFRTMKTALLEMRAIYVRKSNRTPSSCIYNHVSLYVGV